MGMVVGSGGSFFVGDFDCLVKWGLEEQVDLDYQVQVVVYFVYVEVQLFVDMRDCMVC